MSLMQERLDPFLCFLSVVGSLPHDQTTNMSFHFVSTRISISLNHFTNSSFFLYQLNKYSLFEGVLYCKPHFAQRFERTGSLDKSFEGKQKFTYAEMFLALFHVWIQCPLPRLMREIAIDPIFPQLVLGTPKAVKNEKLNDGEVQYYSISLGKLSACNNLCSSRYQSIIHLL